MDDFESDVRDFEIDSDQRSHDKLSDTERHLGLSMFGLVRPADSGRSMSRLKLTLPKLLLKPQYVVNRMSVGAMSLAIKRECEVTATAFHSARESFEKQIEPLSKKLGLRSSAIMLLQISSMLHSNATLQVIARAMPTRHRAEMAEQLKVMFGGNEADWCELFTASSALIECGLLNSSRFYQADNFWEYASSLRDLSEGIELGVPLSTWLLSGAVQPLGRATLALDDFRHLGTDLEILKLLVDLSNGNSQLLLLGSPGVGKTQLAKALAECCNRTLLEVRSDDNEGNAAGRDERFQNFSLAQKLLPDSARHLLLFDEAEDVFIGEHWENHNGAGYRRKGWTTQVLERCTIPTIWISNSLDRIDPAYLRRFDHIVQVCVPPRSVRRGMVERALSKYHVSTNLLDCVAESDRLSPADIARADRVLGQIKSSTVAVDELARCVLGARPDGVPSSLLKARAPVFTIPYRMDLINCDIDFEPVLNRLRINRRGTLAFFGPPGTGKTELARHIASALDRPLHLKKASDLLSCWVGKTEKNIANAFEQAITDEAVLFLDESDSFLQDRANASRRWEISGVNELLAQLDGYAGIAILATNYVESLDIAVMRRFDIKATLGYLKPSALRDLCYAVLSQYRCEDLIEEQTIQAMAVQGVNFGDFSAALRSFGLRGIGMSATALIDGLSQEVKARSKSKRSIGFRQDA